MNMFSRFGYYGLLVPAIPAVVAGGAGCVVGKAMGRLAGLPFGNKTADRLSELGGDVGMIAIGVPVVATTMALVGTGLAAGAVAKHAFNFASAGDFLASRSDN